MSISQLTATDLCRQLRGGWAPEHTELPRELLRRLSARWQANLESQKSAGPSAYRVTMELTRVRLLGALDLGCLLLGPAASVERETAAFLREQGCVGRLALILAITPAVKEDVQRAAFSMPCVLLADGEIETLLSEPHPLELLKQHLRRQISVRRLIPYDLIHPAPPNMFFGQSDLLERLSTEPTTSFAIAGPGRSGKSSLLQQYRYLQRRRPRHNAGYQLPVIDCYDCRASTADEFALRVALEISADSEASRVNRSTFLRFLRRHSQQGRQPIELHLDEVDTVCANAAFHELGEAVHNNYCRLILCGKGNLHRMLRTGDTHFAHRLELIQLRPLDRESAERLLLEPLSDLGFTVPDQDVVCERVLAMASRRPHLIQALAKRIIHLALDDHSSAISPDHLRRAEEDFALLSSTMFPLDDMQDDLTRLVALLWLRAGGGNLTVASLQELAQESGFSLSASKALDICYDLWICNVSVFERGTFALANQHLVHFVRKMDFSREIARLKQAAAASRLRCDCTIPDRYG